jgi:hypothetical protein
MTADRRNLHVAGQPGLTEARGNVKLHPTRLRQASRITAATPISFQRANSACDKGAGSRVTHLSLACSERACRFDCGFAQRPGQHLFCLGSIAQSSKPRVSSQSLSLLMKQTQETSGTFLKTLRHPIPAPPGAAAEPSHIKVGVCRVDT